MSYTSYEIQDISSEFRNVARRLSRTDYSQCDANLKRFMAIIQSNEIIAGFINSKNIHNYDVAAIIESREWLAPFEVSPDISEEISLEYQFLTYSIENFDGDFTRLYGTYRYTGTKSTINDEMQKFIEHIIDPFIDHISEFLRHCYEQAVREEEKSKPSASGNITANYSTVVVGSKVDGNVSTQVTINESTKDDALELITAIKDALPTSDIDEKDDIVEILKQIEEDLGENKKPPKGFLSALKTLCAGSTTVISLVTALIKLFTAA
mgnify:CR=1 FL=1